MKAVVIGAGAMGTAVAFVLERAGVSVTICATEFDGVFVDSIRNDRMHPTLRLPFPLSIDLVDPGKWEAALGEAAVVFVAVASPGVRGVVRAAAASLEAGAIWAVVSKGWDRETAEPLSAVLAQESPDHPLVLVVGPSLAGELAAGTPTALVCAGRDLDAARLVASALKSDVVRTFVSDDVAGVEVGAALKNVLAIAIGFCDGISEAKGKPMTNTKAALFSRGLIEMARLARALGGRQETILGLAGAGDLFVTVLGGRNGRFGRLVGTGVPPAKAIEEMGTTVEGFENTKEAVMLAERFDLPLPVVSMVHAVLYEGADPDDAVSSLMLAPVEEEV